ncbi:hypothetical protein CPC08DRAFT_651550 [Agrocybe pediades]|nr:hypothetical protein CPC08DRAFT_651550 [Agrocybe pediades]
MFGRLLKFGCPYAKQGCHERFRSQKGRTKHVRTFHTLTNACEVYGPLVPEAFVEETLQHEPLAVRESPPPQPDHPPNLNQTTSPFQPNPARTRKYHPYLTAGAPCDVEGNPLPSASTPPPPWPAADHRDWAPFEDVRQFRVGDFLYRKNEMSAREIDDLMDMWMAGISGDSSDETDLPPFDCHEHLHDVIDAIKLGDAPWKSFKASYAGPLPNKPAAWQLQEYEVCFRDPRVVVENILSNPDFDGEFDYAPFVELDASEQRCWNEFLSGNFSWRHATTIYESDNSIEGATYCPIILGADKTTVSVATGHVEYHPLYLTIGNIHNTVRRGHRNGVIPIGFLAIPKSERKYDEDGTFRKFRKQLYHDSIAAILASLRDGMVHPVVLHSPDGHYRRWIFDLAGFIADYPEQVYLAGTVSNWCPKCTALPSDLDGPRTIRTRSLTDQLKDTLDAKVLWNEYGIDKDVVPFTQHFPRADIHEMLTPDLLHQLIKGTFKDHLVTWVGEYLLIAHGSEAKANEILDDIDRRIAATPLFPNLRRFPQGRRFKQWTGDDSKALMKVYLAAITGHVPDDMVRAISAFLDIAYIARRSDINENSLRQFDKALEKFYSYQDVFIKYGVRQDFSLPRQHALSHYRTGIMEFGAPNGICSSITESRHITAVKKPWRRSNRFATLGQMLVINQRLDKLHAAKMDFIKRGMLPHHVGIEALQTAAAKDVDADGTRYEDSCTEARPLIEAVEGNVTLARTRARGYPRKLEDLAAHIGYPNLPDLTRRFLHRQQNMKKVQDNTPAPVDLDNDPTADPADPPECSEYPQIPGNTFSVFHSAIASFYSPSDECGLRGVCRERIRSCPSWQDGPQQRDCTFIVENEEKNGFRGMSVVRVQLAITKSTF